jgi:hypothetical protein
LKRWTQQAWQVLAEALGITAEKLKDLLNSLDLLVDQAFNFLRFQPSSAEREYDLVFTNFTPWELVSVDRWLVGKEATVTTEWDVYIVDQPRHLRNIPRVGRIRHWPRRDLALVLSARDAGRVDPRDVRRSESFDERVHPLIH